MTTSNFKLIAATAMIATLAGGVGTGIFYSQAGDDPQAAVSKTKKEDEKPQSNDSTSKQTTASGEPLAVKTGRSPGPGTMAETTLVLYGLVPQEIKKGSYTVGTLFNLISDKFGVTVRHDEQFLRSAGVDNVLEKGVDFQYDPRNLKICDLLAEIKNQVAPGPGIGFRIKANQFILGKVYTQTASVLSGQPTATDSNKTPAEIIKDLHGPSISLLAIDLTFNEIIELIRDESGANIVVNASSKTLEKKISLTINNTSVYTIIKIVSDKYNLAPAIMENVYYITSPSEAEKINHDMSLSLFGKEKPTSIYIPVDREGKFIAPGADGFRGQKIQIIPIFVESDKEKAKSKMESKAEEKKQ